MYLSTKDVCARGLIMEVRVLGLEMSREIRRWRDLSWDEIIVAAGERFGESGRMFALLHRPTSVHRTMELCEGSLEDAGLGVEQILRITEQKRNIRGLQKAIALVRDWVKADVCPNFLKEGVCSEKDCQLKHELPQKVPK